MNESVTNYTSLSIKPKISQWLFHVLKSSSLKRFTWSMIFRGLLSRVSLSLELEFVSLNQFGNLCELDIFRCIALIIFYNNPTFNRISVS